MASLFRKLFGDIENDRPRLSMLGKGLIILIGIVVVAVINFLNKCNNKGLPDSTIDERWIESKFILPAYIGDSLNRVDKYVAFGVDNLIADSLASYVYRKTKDGTSIKRLSLKQLDSISVNSNKKLSGNSGSSLYYVNCFNSNDFVIVLNDSLFHEIIEIEDTTVPDIPQYILNTE